MKHFDYYFSESWGGYLSVCADSREEADEKIRAMNHDDFIRSGLTDSVAFNDNEIGICCEWDEDNEFYHDEPWKDRVVRKNAPFFIMDKFCAPEPKPPFSRDEMNLISDALLLTIQNASKAMTLLSYAPDAQKEIAKRIETLRDLNSKVCGMMK